jgi:hypothetical protein
MVGVSLQGVWKGGILISIASQGVTLQGRGNPAFMSAVNSKMQRHWIAFK